MLARYWILVVATFLGIAVAFALVLIASQWAPARIRRFTIAVGSLLIGVAGLEMAAWVVLHDELAIADPDQMRAYMWLLNDRFAEHDDPGSAADGMAGNGRISIYMPHPFLNFVLNPHATYMGEAQFDSRYLIRRREP